MSNQTRELTIEEMDVVSGGMEVKIGNATSSVQKLDDGILSPGVIGAIFKSVLAQIRPAQPVR